MSGGFVFVLDIYLISYIFISFRQVRQNFVNDVSNTIDKKLQSCRFVCKILAAVKVSRVNSYYNTHLCKDQG